MASESGRTCPRIPGLWLCLTAPGHARSTSQAASPSEEATDRTGARSPGQHRPGARRQSGRFRELHRVHSSRPHTAGERAEARRAEAPLTGHTYCHHSSGVGGSQIFLERGDANEVTSSRKRIPRHSVLHTGCEGSHPPPRFGAASVPCWDQTDTVGPPGDSGARGSSGVLRNKRMSTFLRCDIGV